MTDKENKLKQLQDKLHFLLFPKDNKWRIDEIEYIRGKIKKLEKEMKCVKEEQKAHTSTTEKDAVKMKKYLKKAYEKKGKMTNPIDNCSYK